MQSEISTISPYYETVTKPTQYMGIKIPDGGSVSTAVVSCIDYYQMQSSTSQPNPGICGIALGYYQPPSGNDYGSLLPNDNRGVNPYTFGLVSGPGGLGPDDNYKPFTGTPSRVYLSGLSNSGDSVASILASFRLVSAEVECSCLGSNFTNQGEIIFGYVPPYLMDLVFEDYTQIDVATLKTMPGMKVSPLAQNKIVAARYLPLDPMSNIFLDCNVVQTDVTNQIRDRGCFIFVAIGMTTTTDVVFDVKVTVNYEYVPKISTVSYASSSPCENDPIGLAVAHNQLLKVPSAYTKNSMSTVSATPLSGAGVSFALKSKNAKLSKMEVRSDDKSAGLPKRLPIFHTGPVRVTAGPMLAQFIPLLSKIGSNVTDLLFNFITKQVDGKKKVEKKKTVKPPPLPPRPVPTMSTPPVANARKRRRRRNRKPKPTKPATKT